MAFRVESRRERWRVDEEEHEEEKEEGGWGEQMVRTRGGDIKERWDAVPENRPDTERVQAEKG